MADPTPLSLTDVETISESVLLMVKQYPNLPFTATASNVLWQSLAKTESIGIYTLQGAIYLRKYVSGSYVAQFPFRVVYKVNPTTSKARISKQSFMENLSSWLTGCTATFNDEHITLEKIERTSPVIKIEADADGFEQYTFTMNLIYQFTKKG